MKETLDLQKIKNLLKEFVKQREWDQYHSPKNLVMALAVETGELVEIFQWLNEKECSCIHKDPNKMQAIKHEIADVMYFLILLSDKLGIDLENAIEQKLEINKQKYPEHLVKGSRKKYTEYSLDNTIQSKNKD